MMLPSPDAGSHRRRILALVFSLVVLHAALAWVMRTPGLAWGEDDARFAILAREIAGGTYRQRWDVAAPVEARFPPAFPALLAATNAVVGEHLDVQLAVIILCSAASLLLLFDAVRRRLGDASAVFVTGLLAINSATVAEAGNLMSESLFRLLATTTLWSASMPSPRTRDLLVAAAAAALSAITRSAGVAVIAALLAYWVLERRWKAASCLLIGSLPVAAWLLWTSSAPDPAARDLYLDSVVGWTSAPARIGWTRFAGRLLDHLWMYVRHAMPTSLSFPALKNNPLDNLLWAALLAVTVPVGFAVLWQRWRLLVGFLVFYGVVLMLWPYVEVRFVSPWNGFLLAMIAAGVLGAAGRWTRRIQYAALAGISALLMVGAFQSAIPVLRDRVACDRSNVSQSPPCFSEDRRGYLQLAEFVRENTPPDAVFFAAKEGAFYFHSQRRTVSDYLTVRVAADSIGRHLRERGATYAVVTPIGIPRRRHNRLIAQACREFEVVRAFDGDAVLLRVRPEGPIGYDDETCLLVAPWKDGVPSRWIVE